MKNHAVKLLSALAGAGVGYLYYHFFGCAGSCPITSDPWRTMAYFALIGFLLSILAIPSRKI